MMGGNSLAVRLMDSTRGASRDGARVKRLMDSRLIKRGRRPLDGLETDRRRRDRDPIVGHLPALTKIDFRAPGRNFPRERSPPRSRFLACHGVQDFHEKHDFLSRI